jgi:hypothetical protein
MPGSSRGRYTARPPRAGGGPCLIARAGGGEQAGRYGQRSQAAAGGPYDAVLPAARVPCD